jgi:predicted signal transduction protein with EAL and GGDEF domain
VRVNEVKVDRSFVAGLVDSENSRALVRATVQLAHSLGARAVGEGVEDEQLAEALRQLGCDFAQGLPPGAARCPPTRCARPSACAPCAAGARRARRATAGTCGPSPAADGHICRRRR